MKYFLTFDGAPHSPYTEKILAVLADFNIKATFFIEGHRIAGQEALLQRIVDEGHGLGNHTFSHEILEEMSVVEVIDEVERCDKEIRRVTGLNIKAFRPPWGKISCEVAEALVAKGYVPICWNTSVKDFLLDDASILAHRLIDCAKDYVVAVMHDSVDLVPEALEQALPKLKEMGIEFAVIEDYLGKC